jgi:hypothetical protein
VALLEHCTCWLSHDKAKERKIAIIDLGTSSRICYSDQQDKTTKIQMNLPFLIMVLSY